MKTRLLGAACACAFTLATATVQAALLGRLPATPGGTDYQAYYDTTLNITWLADANLAASNTFGLPTGVSLGTYPGDTSGVNGIIYASGRMNWPGAKFWIDAMNAANYLGYNDWRLPTLGPINGSAFDYNFAYDGSTDRGYNITAPGSAHAGSTASEMAHLFYNTLSNTGYYDTSGNLTGCAGAPNYCLTNTGPFANLQPYDYWPGLGYAPGISSAWVFGFGIGSQSSVYEGNDGYAWAVRPGDVSAVPVPAAVWLFGSGLIGLLGVARRKR